MLSSYIRLLQSFMDEHGDMPVFTECDGKLWVVRLPSLEHTLDGEIVLDLEPEKAARLTKVAAL